jgi:hypothetical protein
MHFEDVKMEEMPASTNNKSSGNSKLGVLACFLSGISAIIYFCTSYGVKNHIIFLFESLKKTLEN